MKFGKILATTAALALTATGVLAESHSGADIFVQAFWLKATAAQTSS